MSLGSEFNGFDQTFEEIIKHSLVYKHNIQSSYAPRPQVGSSVSSATATAGGMKIKAQNPWRATRYSGEPGPVSRYALLAITIHNAIFGEAVAMTFVTPSIRRLRSERGALPLAWRKHGMTSTYGLYIFRPRASHERRVFSHLVTRLWSHALHRPELPNGSTAMQPRRRKLSGCSRTRTMSIEYGCCNAAHGVAALGGRTNFGWTLDAVSGSRTTARAEVHMTSEATDNFPWAPGICSNRRRRVEVWLVFTVNRGSLYSDGGSGAR
ncbi:hypothetical protein C8Q76DRAFT_694555 [Earliella scabrosa]|nr:hypothetical protein C8Q76DRAFT_694555 [Earliella scabrosa]